MVLLIREYLLVLLLSTCILRGFGENLFFPSWADEILAILFILFSFFSNKINHNAIIKVIKYGIIPISIYTIIGYFVGLIYGNGAYSIAMDIVETIKVPLFFCCFIVIKYERYLYNKAIKAYIYLNIPSIIVGLLQWYYAKFFGVFWGVSQYRERWLGIRISGLAGHNIAMGFSMMFFIIFILEELQKKKNRTLRYILLISAIGCLMFTQSRLPTLLTFLYIAYKYIYLKLDKGKKIVLIYFIVLCALISLPTYFYGVKKIIYDESQTIRSMTISTGLSTLYDKPLFGYGFGSFGVQTSVHENISLYKNYKSAWIAKDLISSGATREAYLFQIIIATGILGCICYYFVFFYVLRRLVKKKLYEQAYFLFGGLIVQSIFNSIYQMPVLYIVTVLCAYSLTHERIMKIIWR